MTINSAILRWRRMEERLFSSTVTVTQDAGVGDFNPNTGQHDPPDDAVVYQGPALIESFTWEGTTLTVSETEKRMQGAKAKFPHDTPVKVGHIVTVNSSRNDADIVGRAYRITDVHHSDRQIVRRAILEEAVAAPQ